MQQVCVLEPYVEHRSHDKPKHLIIWYIVYVWQPISRSINFFFLCKSNAPYTTISIVIHTFCAKLMPTNHLTQSHTFRTILCNSRNKLPQFCSQFLKTKNIQLRIASCSVYAISTDYYACA